MILTVGLRLFYSALAALLAPRLKLDPRLVYSNELTHNLMQRSEGLRYALWGVWERFDTLWYIHIAQNGYDRPDSVVFFPAYPLLLKMVSAILGQPLAAGLLVSTVSSFFLFWGFQRLLQLDAPAEVVRSGVLLYAVWPASFILFAAYPESLVAALLVWSIYFARAGKWWWAGLLGSLAGITKAVGLLVAIPLAILAARARARRALPAALCLAGPIAFGFFLQASAASLALHAYPQYWRTQIAFPWQTLYESFRLAILDTNPLLLGNLLVLLAIAALTFSKKLRLEYAAFALAVLALFLVKKTEPLLQSSMRYVLVVFPAFANLASCLSRPVAFTATALALFILNLFLMGLFLEWSLVV